MAVLRINVQSLFATYSLGINTARDATAYDFDKHRLLTKVEEFFENYDSEVSRWARAGKPEDVDAFVRYDKVKWSRNLKRDLRHERRLPLDAASLRTALYRPFTRMWLYRSDLVVDELGTSRGYFPAIMTERENQAICLTIPGSEKPFLALTTNAFPDLHLVGAGAGTGCFPLYTYDEDGSNRRENVTDWALGQFRAKYGEEVTKRDIFDYVYGLLHHPAYRERYAENLKRELPRIPLLPTRAEYEATREAGAQLAALHLGYETVREYPLTWRFTPGMAQDWRVKKMKLTAEKSAVVYNEWLTLEGVPAEAFEYRLGNRSALEWVIDQYQVSTDGRSGIVSDPNRSGSEEERQYVARLVGRVVTVSVETARLVRGLAARVDLLAAVGAER
jgi:predicted helicase